MKTFMKPKKPLSPMARRINKFKRSARFFKIKLLLFITLPVAVVTIGQAVLKEFIKVRVRQAAESARNELSSLKAKEKGSGV